MAEPRHDTKVSPEGRIVIPSAVREVLGIHGGDRVQFVVEGSTVRIVSARSLLLAVWANNTGGDAGDSVTDIRAARTADNAAVADKWDRVDADAGADADLNGSEDDIEAGLLAQLDLT
jgi:AbrB family looped-hinge helix DNA binding protein